MVWVRIMLVVTVTSEWASSPRAGEARRRRMNPRSIGPRPFRFRTLASACIFLLNRYSSHEHAGSLMLVMVVLDVVKVNLDGPIPGVKYLCVRDIAGSMRVW